MHTHRPGNLTASWRREREEAAARRLATLAADLNRDPGPAVTGEAATTVMPTRWPGVAGTEESEAPEPPENRHHPGEPSADEHSPVANAPDEPVHEPLDQTPHEPRDDGARSAVHDAASLPRPGRHAHRRRIVRLPAIGLPGFGPAHLAVLAVLVALTLAATSWWLLRARPAPATEPAAPADPLAVVSSPAEAEAEADPTTGMSTATGTVTVDVAGKVRRPGIVVLDEGARVVDALEAAGGPRKGVPTHTLNLARVLADGEQIVVGRPRGAGPALAPHGEGRLVDLNRADATELEELPGVGPVTAAAIVEWRDEHGGFRSVDQLIDVSGIGEKTLAEIAPHATV